MLEQIPLLDLGESISSPADSPARTSASLAPGKASPESGADYGPSLRELSGKFAPAGQLLRMLLGLELSALTRCSLHWRHSATPLGRSWWVLSMPERPTDGSGFGLLPTPVSNDDNKSPEAHMRMKKNMKGGPRNTITSLNVMAKAGMLPTPRANDAEKRGDFDCHNPRNGLPAAVKRMMLPTPKAADGRTKGNGGGRKSPGLDQMARKGMLPTPHSNCHTGPGHAAQGGENLQTAVANGTGPGRLSPCFVEWMMGYPAGWTDVSD